MQNNNVKIKNIKDLNDLKKLVEVFSLAFENDYALEDAYLEKMKNDDRTTVLGVYAEDKIIGGLVAFEFFPIHGSKEMYVYDIAIHPDHQKKGYGKMLFDHLKKLALEKGVKTIFVEAESEDSGAVSFYRAIGGQEVKVNHFNFEI